MKYSSKTAGGLAVAVLLLCGFAGLLLATYGAGPQTLLKRCLLFYSFAEQHAWLLMGLYLLRLVFLLPASFVLFLTGMIYGSVLGEVIAVAGLTLSGSIEFLLVRGSFSSVLSRSSNKYLLGWRERISRAPFHSILLMRICFVPFDPVNIVAALARAPLRSFVFATALGTAPTSLPIVASGASIDFRAWMASGRIWPSEGVVNWTYLALSGLLVILIVLHARSRERPNPATMGETQQGAGQGSIAALAQDDPDSPLREGKRL